MILREPCVYTIKEFMCRDGADRGVKRRDISSAEVKQVGFFSGVTLPLLVKGYNEFLTQPQAAEVMANTVDITERTVRAFDPFIHLIQALAYPVGMVVVLGGALFIMIGNKEKGFTMLQSAGFGYVLVQMAPMLMNILVQAMKGI